MWNSGIQRTLPPLLGPRAGKYCGECVDYRAARWRGINMLFARITRRSRHSSHSRTPSHPRFCRDEMCGTPHFIKTRLWIGRRRNAALASSANARRCRPISTNPAAWHRARSAESHAHHSRRRSIISSPKKCAGDTGMVITAACNRGHTGVCAGSWCCRRRRPMAGAGPLIWVGIAAALLLASPYW